MGSIFSFAMKMKLPESKEFKQIVEQNETSPSNSNSYQLD